MRRGDEPGEILSEFEYRGETVRIRTFQPGDEAGLIDCYNSIFPVDHPSQLPQTRALWDWKFSTAVSGRREVVLADHERAGVIGAYPCVPLRVRLRGEERWASQIVDLMVRHDWRRVGPRPGLFVTLGNAFYQRYCGGASELQAFNYGWPVPAWRIGQRYLRYENVRDWNFLAKEVPVEEDRLVQAPRGFEIVEVDRPAREVDDLFERASVGSELTLVKDRTYLQWRYVEHPERDYRLFECRGPRGGLRGMAVYTRGGLLRPDTSFLCDWLVAPGDEPAVRCLVAACERAARHDETGVLAGVFNPADPRFGMLQDLGYRVWDSGYFLVVAPFAVDTLWMRGAWPFTMGDSDLI